MSLWQTAKFSSLTARLGNVPRWKSTRVQRLAARRLHQLVRLAVERSPFYRERYRGIDPSRFELAQLPPATKDELRNQFDRVVTDSRVTRAAIERWTDDPANLGRWFLGQYAVSHTSGSQGAPLPIVQDRRSLEILFALMSARANAGTKPGLLEGIRRLRRPARLAIVAQKRGFYPSGAAFEFMRQLVGPFVDVRWLSATQPDLIDQLNDYQPNSLVGYASVLDALALQSQHLRLRELKQVANSSEQLTRRARTRIQQAFGVRVMDHYGLGECLFLSDGCPTDGGAHINADWAIVEVVDDAYRPVPDGQLGSKVLITNLANTVQPFIRYEVGDRIALTTQPCRCGSRLPRIERIEGRGAELFWYAKADGYGMLPGVLFHSASDSLHEVREWQAVQTGRNAVTLRVQLLPTAGPARDITSQLLLLRLREFGLPSEIAIQIEFVDALSPDPNSGKLRRMISQVGPPADLSRPRHAASTVSA